MLRKLHLIAAVCLLFSAPALAANIFWSPNVTAGGGASCNDGTFAWDTDSGSGGAAHKCWATTSGGTTAAAIPGTSDSALFDANSGGGTVAVNGNFTNVSIDMTGFTGTLDYSVNNNSPTFTSSNICFNSTGTATQTLKMGNGTWTCSGTNTNWTATNTNLTVTPGNSTVQFTSTNATARRQFNSGGKTFNNVTVVQPTTSTAAGMEVSFTGAGTYNTITATGPMNLTFAQGLTSTITTLTLNGTYPASMIRLSSTGNSGTATISATTATVTGAAINLIVASPLFTATDSIDLGGNTVTIVNPAGGATPYIIGGQ